MSKKNKSGKLHIVFFLLMGFVLFAFEMFSLGLDSGQGRVLDAIADGILAFLWLGFIVITIIQYQASTDIDSLERESKELQKLSELMKELADNVEGNISEHDETLVKIANEIYLEVTDGGGRKPTTEETALIEVKFHEKTKHFLHIVPRDGEMNMFVQHELFTEEEKADLVAEVDAQALANAKERAKEVQAKHDQGLGRANVKKSGETKMNFTNKKG